MGICNSKIHRRVDIFIDDVINENDKDNIDKVINNEDHQLVDTYICKIRNLLILTNEEISQIKNMSNEDKTKLILSYNEVMKYVELLINKEIE
jgi:hypothetical protein